MKSISTVNVGNQKDYVENTKDLYVPQLLNSESGEAAAASKKASSEQKPVALAIIELCHSEGISKSFSRKLD